MNFLMFANIIESTALIFKQRRKNIQVDVGWFSADERKQESTCGCLRKPLDLNQNFLLRHFKFETVNF